MVVRSFRVGEKPSNLDCVSLLVRPAPCSRGKSEIVVLVVAFAEICSRRCGRCSVASARLAMSALLEHRIIPHTAVRLHG